ncbi:MAG: hypothetical protein AB7O45_13065 [Alphaproteobacteria bacterium]
MADSTIEVVFTRPIITRERLRIVVGRDKTVPHERQIEDAQQRAANLLHAAERAGHSVGRPEIVTSGPGVERGRDWTIEPAAKRKDEDE